MKSRLLAAFSLLILVFSSGVFAQATRTWVSGVGDDVNPCSRTAPCKTFAGAISKTAAGGIISVLDPGGFGAVTITKSITLDGGGVDGSITSTTTAITVNAAATDHVVIRRLTIYGTPSTGTGVRILNNTGNVTVEQTLISGFSNGIEQASSGQIYVHETQVRKSTNHGMLVTSGKALVENSRFEQNAVDGIRVATAGRAVVKRSTAAQNLDLGFVAVGGTLIVEDGTIANNNFGIGASSSGTTLVGNSLIVNTTNTGVYNDGTGSVISMGGNALARNGTDGTFSSTQARQ